MPKLTPEDILAMATENGLENPRVIPRKLASGSIVYALKYGPADDRVEFILRPTDPRAFAVEAMQKVAAVLAIFKS